MPKIELRYHLINVGDPKTIHIGSFYKVIARKKTYFIYTHKTGINNPTQVFYGTMIFVDNWERKKWKSEYFKPLVT